MGAYGSAGSTIPITIDVPEYATPQSHPEYHLWKFIRNDNTAITGRWAFIKNPYAQDGQPSEGWFFFDNDGWMQHGWYLGPDGNWYVLHDTSDGMLGTMLTGWYKDDQDGKLVLSQSVRRKNADRLAEHWRDMVLLQ